MLLLFLFACGLLHVVEFMHEVDSTLAFLGSANRYKLEVHLIGSVLCAYNLVSSTLHVIELTHKDGREASFDVVNVG